MVQAPLHEWLRPRLETLFREAASRGFEREATAAVMVDLATSDAFNTAPLPDEPAPPHGPWPHPSGDSDRELDEEVGAVQPPDLLGHLLTGTGI